MKIESLRVELLRASSAVAEFLIQVALDDPTPAQVKGRVIGPRCPGVSTVEVAYSLALVETRESAVTLKGVIPEPNLWTAEMPFQYAAAVELWEDERQIDSRECLIAFKER